MQGTSQDVHGDKISPISKSEWAVGGLVVIFIFAVILSELSGILGLTPGVVLQYFMLDLYNPNKNLFSLYKIAHVNPLIYLYYIFFNAAVILAVLKSAVPKWPTTRSLKFPAPLLMAGVATLVLSVGLQSVGHLYSFATSYLENGNKTTEEKISLRFDKGYRFAEYCKTRYPGKHAGKQITDIDLKTKDGMLASFIIAYYLYPIDIRVDQRSPKDCLVIFLKENPLGSVTRNFVPLESFDKTSLIAIKKQ